MADFYVACSLDTSLLFLLVLCRKYRPPIVSEFVCRHLDSELIPCSLCREVDFRTHPRLAIPEDGNVTIQCGGRSLDTYSSEGPMHLGRGAVIGLQGCIVNTFRDVDEAISAGRRSDAFVSIFGDPVNGVAQVSSSEIFFPADVRCHPVFHMHSLFLCVPRHVGVARMALGCERVL